MGCRRRTNWWVAEILVESITLFVVFLSFYLSLWWLLFQYLLRFSAIAANVPNSPWFTSIVCMCVCVYEYQYTITCAYISLVLSLFRFHVDLLEQWTVVHYLIWLVCLAACFVFVVFFRLIPFIIMELATEHFVYITLRFRLRLSAALYYVMSNNIDKSHLNGNRAECTSCRAHHGHRQPDNFDDENRENKWNSCRF